MTQILDIANVWFSLTVLFSFLPARIFKTMSSLLGLNWISRVTFSVKSLKTYSNAVFLRKIIYQINFNLGNAAFLQSIHYTPHTLILYTLPWTCFAYLNQYFIHLSLHFILLSFLDWLISDSPLHDIWWSEIRSYLSLLTIIIIIRLHIYEKFVWFWYRFDLISRTFLKYKMGFFLFVNFSLY